MAVRWLLLLALAVALGAVTNGATEAGGSGMSAATSPGRINLRASNLGTGFVLVTHSSHGHMRSLVAFPRDAGAAPLSSLGATATSYVSFTDHHRTTVTAGIYRFGTQVQAGSFYRRMVAAFGDIPRTDVVGDHPVPVAVRVGDEGVTAQEFPFTPPPLPVLTQVVFRRGLYAVEVDVSDTAHRIKALRLARIIDRRIRGAHG